MDGLKKQIVGWVDTKSKFPPQPWLGKSFMNCQPLQWKEMTQHQQIEFATNVSQSSDGIQELHILERVRRLVQCAHSPDGCGWRAHSITQEQLQSHMDSQRAILNNMP